MTQEAPVSLRQWLECLKLDQYLSALTDAGYTTVEKCGTLTNTELDRLGITPPGHKRRILSHLPSGGGDSGGDAGSAASIDQNLPSCGAAGEDETDTVYDVPCAPPLGSRDSSPEPLYMNLEDLHKDEETPPALPQKLKPHLPKENVAEKLGLAHSQTSSPSPESSAKMRKVPVPTPRGSIARRKLSGEPVPKVRGHIPFPEEGSKSATPTQSEMQAPPPTPPSAPAVTPSDHGDGVSDMHNEVPSPWENNAGAMKSPRYKFDTEVPLPVFRTVKKHPSVESVKEPASEGVVKMPLFGVTSTSSNTEEEGDGAAVAATAADQPSPSPCALTAADLDMLENMTDRNSSHRNNSVVDDLGHVQSEVPKNNPEMFDPLSTPNHSSEVEEEEEGEALYCNTQFGANGVHIQQQGAVGETKRNPSIGSIDDKPPSIELYEEALAVISDAFKDLDTVQDGYSEVDKSKKAKRRPDTEVFDNESNEAIYEATKMKSHAFDSGRGVSPKMDSSSCSSMDSGSRTSTLSADVPPPAFSPPPLPSGTELGFPVSPSREHGPMVPPRPRESALPPSSCGIKANHMDTGPMSPRSPDKHKSGITFGTVAAATKMFLASKPGAQAHGRPKHGVQVLPMVPSEPDPLEVDAECCSATCEAGASGSRAEEDNFYSTEPTTPSPFEGLWQPGQETDELEDIAAYHAYEPVTSPCSPVCDSDDTLSEGGDFFFEGEIGFEGPQIETLKRDLKLPIVGGVEPKATERKGYLYKHATQAFTLSPENRKSSILGWSKRWVTLDQHCLKYFSNSKSVAPKRVIPICTMWNVETMIKTGESHPYQFRLTTVDRRYTFAADSSDDLTWWTNMLMWAIIDCKDEFAEAGAMRYPNKQGFVKMEKVKAKRYFAIKKDMFCYYNSIEDFRAFSPIHQIEMKLASVRDQGKMRLQFTTPSFSHIFVFDTQKELNLWKGAFEEAIADGLGDDSIMSQIYENHSNQMCADCGSADPHWASVNLGITICKQCAGIHRQIGVQYSKVKSLRMDLRVWSDTLKQMMQAIGNENANRFWEWTSSEEDKIDADADMDMRQDYITAKYKDHAFCQLHPLHDDQAALDEALCKSVQFCAVAETMQLLFSGAKMSCKCTLPGMEGQTPFEIAKKAKQSLQEEFLMQNGAESSWTPTDTHTQSTPAASSRSEAISVKDYLFKTGSNTTRTDFLKRWCVLENGTLSYYDSERSVVAKDTINKQEMLTINTATDDRMEHAFEVGTTKMGGRVYLFAAGTVEKRQKWISSLAKTIAYIPRDAANKLDGLQRGGNVYIKDGCTKDWSSTWIHLKDRTLFVFNKEKKDFDEVDLRKVVSMKMLPVEERCRGTYEESRPFVISLPKKRVLYIQGDLRKDTELWYSATDKAATEVGLLLQDQQLTDDDLPLAVDKCLDFVSIYGVNSEGIYRLSGQHGKVTVLVEKLFKDAKGVVPTIQDYTVNDVATALKRFFRNLGNSVLTRELYPKWLAAANNKDQDVKLNFYKYYVGELPEVNQRTLQKVIRHLTVIAENESVNKMSVINLASIFGPVLMKLDNDDSSAGFAATGHEITVVKDLIENYKVLFDVDRKESRVQDEIEQAIKMLNQLPAKHVLPSTGDILTYIYITSTESDPVTVMVSPEMTVLQLMEQVVTKNRLDTEFNWGLFECICNGELERPLHYKEKVLNVTMNWSKWPEKFRKNTLLCLKANHVYEKIELVYAAHNTLYCELKFSGEEKSNKKFCFEFSQFKISIQKSSASTKPDHQWNVEDITVYLGVQHKRNPPTRFAFTFIPNKVPKFGQYFGYSVYCNNEDELYRWIAAIYHAQHGEGLSPGDAGAAQAPAATSSHSDSDTPENAKKESPRLTRNKPSIIRRLWRR